jgi:hypothetical protein
VKKDLEGEGIEAYTKNEVVELLNS